MGTFSGVWIPSSSVRKLIFIDSHHDTNSPSADLHDVGHVWSCSSCRLLAAFPYYDGYGRGGRTFTISFHDSDTIKITRYQRWHYPLTVEFRWDSIWRLTYNSDLQLASVNVWRRYEPVKCTVEGCIGWLGRPFSHFKVYTTISVSHSESLMLDARWCDEKVAFKFFFHLNFTSNCNYCMF